MPRPLPIALAQVPPRPYAGRVSALAEQVHEVLADHPATRLVAFPELQSVLGDVARVRREGTAGVNRMWEQFTAADRPLELPLYQGRIEPGRWRPRGEGAR